MTIGLNAKNEVYENLQNKGSIGNKIEYAGKQTWNAYKTLWKAEADTFIGLTATAAAAAGVAKSKTAQNVLTKGFQALKKTNFAQTAKETLLPYIQKGLATVKALPGPAKAVLAAGTILTSILVNRNQNKMMYQAGKIDQEYTDKAKLQKQLS